MDFRFIEFADRIDIAFRRHHGSSFALHHNRLVHVNDDERLGHLVDNDIVLGTLVDEHIARHDVAMRVFRSHFVKRPVAAKIYEVTRREISV